MGGLGRRGGEDIPAIPAVLAIGDFELELRTVSKHGRWSPIRRELKDVAGTAWLRFPCARPTLHPLQFVELHPELIHLPHAVEVVPEVVHAQTQISLADAIRIAPQSRIGDTLDVAIDARRAALQDIVAGAQGIANWIPRSLHSGGVLVDFVADTMLLEGGPPEVGVIMRGVATYPAVPRIPQRLRVAIAGFELMISSMTVRPTGATGAVTVELPAGLSAPDACGPAMLDLGVIPLPADCEIAVERPSDAYGPWLVGDTGIEIQGTGFTLDLSTTWSPPSKLLNWRGLLLGSGSASGQRLVPDPCNTGYLRGDYSYTTASLTSLGLDATLTLNQPVKFEALNPRGHHLTLETGWLGITHSIISGGGFASGDVTLPRPAVRGGSSSLGGPLGGGLGGPLGGATVDPAIVSLSVQGDLDLAGTVDNGSSVIEWGELTHAPSLPEIVWSGEATDGYLYLAAGPRASYTPETAAGFVSPDVSWNAGTSLAELDAASACGVTFYGLRDLEIFSPDRPHGTANPFKLPAVDGWVRVGHLGVDGELVNYHGLSDERIGNPARPGYVGGNAFQASLFVSDYRNALAQLISSAVYDSDFGGTLNIPAPCNVQLAFAKMQLTSSGNLVGGDVILPTGGVKLDEWKLDLVPTSTSAPAGVVSARIGLIIFLAAGIKEAIHFDKPFGLTWGEMRADGDLGQLFLDYNNWGQRFDGLTYNPNEFRLSPANPHIDDPYLATAGTIVFPFFGVHTVNIRDAYDSDMTHAVSPYCQRNVTVPKNGLATGWPATDLALAGTWKDIANSDLADFACPNANVDYNTKGQNGFVGSGTASLGFLDQGPITADVDIRDNATDIHMSSATTHDLNLSLFARLGGMNEISGCARIEGPLLTRMSLYGSLENSIAAGSILGPKAGYAVDVSINVTPTSFDFYASGDLMLSVGLTDVEAYASMHLVSNFATHMAEGELIGRIRCDAAFTGLSADGQITWHADPGMQYLQGRVKVKMMSWPTSSSLEGGFFLGHEAPANQIWVLQPSNPHLGVNPAILPSHLTGVFAYGQISQNFSVFVLGGGVDIYVAAGALAFGPPGQLTAIVGLGLPYVVGACGIYVHGEILGGLVSASAWANLAIRGPMPLYFDGSIGLEGCAAWVVCASVTLDARLDSDGLHLS